VANGDGYFLWLETVKLVESQRHVPSQYGDKCYFSGVSKNGRTYVTERLPSLF